MNEAPVIPAPAAPRPVPIVVETASNVESSAAGETAVDSAATEVSGAAPTAVEGTQVSPLLPWIVGILALLALCWLALRRFTRRDPEADAGERFVEMVFDEHTAADS